MRRASIVLCCCCALLPVSLLAADAPSDKDLIQYREDVMKTLDEQSAALGQMASGVVPSDTMATDMQILALTASTALKAFTPKAPGGQAKAGVWDNWADFSKRMNDFIQTTAQGAKAAQQSSDSAMTALVDIANGCKGCHDMYREEKKDQPAQ